MRLKRCVRGSLLRTMEAGAIIRRLLLAWIISVTLQYTLLSSENRVLAGLESVTSASFFWLLAGTAVGFLLLSVLGALVDSARAERWGMLGCFGWYTVAALSVSYTLPFFLACMVILAVLAVYAVKGEAGEKGDFPRQEGKTRGAIALTAFFAVGFVAFVGVWTVCRVRTFSCPTYDMGIFTQMFHNMRETGAPVTTLERDGLLSHFRVHVSPIYYLMLPFYAIFPSAETLQILQALVLASAVIPLWLLARRRSFSPVGTAIFCALLLTYPAFSGGTSYDLHENVFLTPLLFWLFYFLERRKCWGIALFSILTLLVKEDAAVYVAVVAIWVILEALLHRDRVQLRIGLTVLLGALTYFLAVTSYLTKYGDGVMTYRYRNFLPDGEKSLTGVVKAVLLSPIKAVYECMDAEKIGFLLQTMLPLLFLPLITRHYERLVLLIPYLLVNLMSDYSYQHDVFFQYTYGATACLFYLTLLNLADLRRWATRRNVRLLRYGTAALSVLALLVSAAISWKTVFPKAMRYVGSLRSEHATYAQIERQLAQIPEDVPVTATTFYTVPLSDYAVLYDLHYCSREHLLESEYVVLCDSETYTVRLDDGKREEVSQTWLFNFLEQNGYVRDAAPDEPLIVYRKS